MQYLALATDYDGTIATKGQVDAATLQALRAWQAVGNKLIMVTGRDLDDLYQIFPEAAEFDCLVVENGARLHFPDSQEEQLLGDRPPIALIQQLHEHQVHPLYVGRVMVATWKPHEQTVRQVIQALGLEWQVILNKDAVMLLPEGVDKAAGLGVVLDRFNLSFEQTVAVGDAENDLAFLQRCGLSVAVANALAPVKAETHWVMEAEGGPGVVELIERLMTNRR
jgi:hypothetical protein